MWVNLNVFVAVPALVGYIMVVYLLRYQRARRLERLFAGRVSFASMTTNDAQSVLKDLTELEFPKFFGFSIIFALFKVCKVGLPRCTAIAYLCPTDLRYPKCILASGCDWAARRC